MKRYLILGVIVAVVTAVLLVWFRQGGNMTMPKITEPTSQALPVTNPSDPAPPQPERPHPNAELADRNEAERDYVAKRDERMRLSNEAGNPDVSFYGLVVDQDTNPLPNVSVALAIIEEYIDPYPQVKRKTTPLQKQTGPDGRFEISGSGLKGKYLGLQMLTKEGYEQEFPGRAETYGVQSGSFAEPIILRMWSTNISHEHLIIGDVHSPVIPDGRRYVVDLTKKTVKEGAEGDLVVWLKRPAEVGSEKYDWSCELTADGLLEETRDSTMLIAPATGYTNVFAFQQEATLSDWTHGLYGKRFYLSLRNGQIYGRVTVNLTANPNRKAAATLRVQYVINPSGSRLLR